MIKLFICISVIGSIHGGSLFKRQAGIYWKNKSLYRTTISFYCLGSIKLKDVAEEITNELEKAFTTISEKQLILLDIVCFWTLDYRFCLTEVFR